MASSSNTTDAEFARLSAAELVVRLRSTIRRAEFDAVARVLAAREREAEAELCVARAQNAALQDALRRMQDEAEEVARRKVAGSTPPDEVEAAEEEQKGVAFVGLGGDSDEETGKCGEVQGVSCKRKARSEDEDEDDDNDKIPLSQLKWKRRGRREAGVGKLEKADGEERKNSVGSLGNGPAKCSCLSREGGEARIVDKGYMLQRSKVAALSPLSDSGMPTRQMGKLEKGKGEMSRTSVSSLVVDVGNGLQKCSSRREEGETRPGKKRDLSAAPKVVVPSPLSNICVPVRGFGELGNGNGEIGNTRADPARTGVANDLQRSYSSRREDGEARVGEKGSPSIVPKESTLSPLNVSSKEARIEGKGSSLVAPKVTAAVSPLTASSIPVRGTGEPKKGNGEMCRTPAGSSSRRDNHEARTKDNRASSVKSYLAVLSPLDGSNIPARGFGAPEKENAEVLRTPAVGLLSKYGDKKHGTDAVKRSSLLRQIKEGEVAEEGALFEEMSITASPLSTHSLLERELCSSEKEGGKLSKKLGSKVLSESEDEKNGISSKKRTRSTVEGDSNDEPIVAALAPLSVHKISGSELCNSMGKVAELHNSSAKKLLSEPEASFSASKGVILSPSSSRSASTKVKRETSLSPSGSTRHWKHEGDMLDSLIYNDELCMLAICVLYRRGKLIVESINGENTGISPIDAYRGTKLVEFLLDGNPRGPLKRTVEELENHDGIALISCRTMAIKYSKQLFDIYKNKEDPYFY